MHELSLSLSISLSLYIYIYTHMVYNIQYVYVCVYIYIYIHICRGYRPPVTHVAMGDALSAPAVGPVPMDEALAAAGTDLYMVTENAVDTGMVATTVLHLLIHSTASLWHVGIHLLWVALWLAQYCFLPRMQYLIYYLLYYVSFDEAVVWWGSYKIGDERLSVRDERIGFTYDSVCFHCRVPRGLPCFPGANDGVSIPTLRCFAHRHLPARVTVPVTAKSWKSACSLAEGIKHRSAPHGHWEGELAIRLPDLYANDSAASGSYVWGVRLAAFLHVFFRRCVHFVDADNVDEGAAVGSAFWLARGAGSTLWGYGRDQLDNLLQNNNKYVYIYIYIYILAGWAASRTSPSGRASSRRRGVHSFLYHEYH